MELVQQFETPVTGRDNNTYIAYLYARLGSHKTWEGLLTFERTSDGKRFETAVETTQSTRDAVRYWAGGLTQSYFEGALERAMRTAPQPPAQPAPPPLVEFGSNANTRQARLADLERQILDMFRKRHQSRLLAQELFDKLPHANADVVRALEALEKQERSLVRRTEEGNDWVILTRAV